MEKTLLDLLEYNMSYKLGYKRSHVKCASINLCYSMDAMFDNPIVVNELTELPLSRTHAMEDEFYSKLDLVSSTTNEDPMWDCSGHVWLNDGNSFTLRVTYGKIDFVFNYTPPIPSHLLNNLN